MPNAWLDWYPLYVFSVWLHIVAAIIWIGGMVFLIWAVVPRVRQGDVAITAFFRETAVRFRNLSWVCFGVIFTTGVFNLAVRGVRLRDFAAAEFHASTFGRAVMAKLAVFAVILGISLSHDFVIGPRASRIMRADPRSAAAQRYRDLARWLGRSSLGLGLLMVLLGVIVVRGF